MVPTFGGPLRPDRLWFYVTYTRQVNDGHIAHNYWNLTPGTMSYTPDLSRPAVDAYWTNDVTGRLTWQATPRNKITGVRITETTTGRVWSPVTGRSTTGPASGRGPRCRT